MKKLTSKSTFFNKKVFPLFWFGFLGVFFLTSLLGHLEENGPPVMFLIAPLFMAIFGYFIMKKYVFDLADEVYDEGESLLFRKKGKEGPG